MSSTHRSASSVLGSSLAPRRRGRGSTERKIERKDRLSECLVSINEARCMWRETEEHDKALAARDKQSTISADGDSFLLEEKQRKNNPPTSQKITVTARAVNNAEAEPSREQTNPTHLYLVAD
ncbi:unnamed protein product, partial [Ectocarpus sp. 4 AP-2014]